MLIDIKFVPPPHPNKANQFDPLVLHNSSPKLSSQLWNEGIGYYHKTKSSLV